ncbi:unnamed protein product [Porites evermanni]|uniref:Uncharacterized protein n=1 Tax=Porites evermanni TaxID=104178 RepID=A0ABN8R1Q3_9CNID|nr:unnamed protein product [Porites evermanni]
MLSDNPVETIGSHAFKIPREDLLIYMIRTKIKTVSLRSFYGIDNLTIDMGLGQKDSEYSVISDIVTSENDVSVRYQIKAAFKQSGFAKKIVGRYELLPCEFGTYVNASAETIKCIECPAGKFIRSL